MRTQSIGRIVFAAALAAGPALAQDAGRDGPDTVSLTIYSLAQPGGVPVEAYRPAAGRSWAGFEPPGYAIVREERAMMFPKSMRHRVRVTGVAALIDPTTVRFVAEPQRGDGTAPGAPMARVLSQAFEFDLVDDASLMRRFLDREITVLMNEGTGVREVTGTLLSAGPVPILRDADGRVHMVRDHAGLSFPELPEGLITRPTLVWDLALTNSGPATARLSYETKGITWWSDYNLVWMPREGAANDGTLDVGAWVSILNQSGASYRDARLKLIAGDVNRVRPQRPAGRGGFEARAMVADAAPAGFEQQAFFEYHLYTLGRPATINDNSTQQLELFPPAAGVPARKVLDFTATGWFGGYGGVNTNKDASFGMPGTTRVSLEFDNKEAAGLGVPLPKGRIRVFQANPADGSLEFIGEDTIDHTPRDETIRVSLGEAFDIVGERTQVSFEPDTRRQIMTERIAIEVRNRKDESVTLTVTEHMFRWSGWTITEATDPYEKRNAFAVQFPVTLEAGATKRIEYTVRYTW